MLPHDDNCKAMPHSQTGVTNSVNSLSDALAFDIRLTYNPVVSTVFYMRISQRGIYLMRAVMRLCPTVSALLLLPLLFGCKKEAAPPPAPAAPPPPPQVSEIDLKSFKPNEAGAVMIVMYHHFDPNRPDTDLNRRPETFRKDLETLYQAGYRPVTVSEFVENRMDVPAGKTPVVLTFDDSAPSQFRVTTGADGSPSIDPDCAVGIMETFSKSKPDWPMKATFFVLPRRGNNGDPFGQSDSASDKLNYLVSKGYEVANHSSTHSSMRRMSADKIRWEISTAIRDIRALAPQAQMQAIALPYGILPRKEAEPALISGEEGGTSYENRAVLLAAWRPVLSPVTKNVKRPTPTGQLAAFNPHRLERITPDARRPNTAGTLEFWLKFFQENPNLRYISDGNPKVVAVPKSMGELVDAGAVKAQGKTLQVYSLTGSGSGGRGGELSVTPSGGKSGALRVKPQTP